MAETGLVLAAIACTGVLALAVALVRSRRLPGEVLARVVALEEARDLDRETIGALIDRAEDAFDRAERKRRSAAAAASRANAAQGADQPENGVPRPLTRAETLARVAAQLGIREGVI